MRKLYNVITHQDADGIKEICLILDDEHLIKNMKNLVKLLNAEIKDLENIEKPLISLSCGSEIHVSCMIPHSCRCNCHSKKTDKEEGKAE